MQMRTSSSGFGRGIAPPFSNSTTATQHCCCRYRPACSAGAAPPPSANEVLHGHERAQRIRSALAQLSGEQRQVIELAFYAGLSQSEIAARLAQPPGTIKARIRRG